jgi:RNA-directed DNA polymerase
VERSRILTSLQRGGRFRDINHGLPRGCPLRPLLGAFFLTELDEELERQNVFTVRYMDDVLIMSNRRWGLRKAIKRLDEIFTGLGLEQYPDKTLIGRIEKGFDFLGYHFSRTGLRLAAKTIANAAEKLHRPTLLIEREQKQTAPEGAAALDDYFTRWERWTTAGCY